MESEGGLKQISNEIYVSDKTSNFNRKIRQYLTTIGAIFPLFVFGLDVGWVSPAMLTLKMNNTISDTPLTNEEISWIASVTGASALVGVFLFGYIAEIRGRKLAIILISIPELISWLLRLYFVSGSLLIVARLIVGLSCGGAFSIIPLYIKEISDPDSRPFLVTLAMLMFKMGMMFAFTAGAILNYFTSIWIYIMIPIMHLALFSKAPESPAYLLNASQKKEAMDVIAWLRQLSPSDMRVSNVVKALEQENIQFSDSDRITLKKALQDKCTYRAFKITAVIQTSLSCNGALVVLTYASIIFKNAGGSMPPNVQAVFVGIAQIISSVLALILVKKFGSRVLMLASFIMVTIWMLILGTWFLLQYVGISFPAWIPVLAVCMIIFSNSISVPTAFMLKIEMFSYRVRTLMACTAMLIQLSSLFVATRLYQPLDTYLGNYVPFFVYATFTIIVTIYFYLNLPEIKDKSFEKIRKQIMFGIRRRHNEAKCVVENVNMVEILSKTFEE